MYGIPNILVQHIAYASKVSASHMVYFEIRVTVNFKGKPVAG